MNSIVAALVALLVATSVAGEVMAQSKQEPGPSPSAPASREGVAVPGPESKMIEGKIKSVDPTGKKVTLEDGTQLQIPDSITLRRDSLRQGATVRVIYEEKGGEKVVTMIEVRPRS